MRAGTEMKLGKQRCYDLLLKDMSKWFWLAVAKQV